MRQDLERFAQPGSLLRRQWQREDSAGVGELLSPPHHPTDLDDLSRPLDRSVVRHTVPALDDLRTGGAEAEDRPTVAQLVQAGDGLCYQGGRPRVDRKDARAELESARAGGQVAQPRRGVVAIRLRHPHHVQAGLLQPHHAVDALREPVAVPEPP
jgi:hypothetical protein